MMKISIKREQGQASLSFAKCEKFRPQVKRSRLWMIAAILLLTVAASAQTTIVIGGVVEAATGQKYGATAVVLQNGRIAYVGNDEGAMTRVLPQKIYDLWYGDDEHYIRTTDTSVSQRPEDNQDCRLVGPLKAWNEVLTLDQTIKASTINGARTLNLDDRIGTIEVGKSAVIMILNMNLRTVGTEELENVSPVITFFEGEKLFVADHAATAVLPIHESAGSNQVRKIMSRGGQVLIKNGATYYNTAGCAHFRPLFNR